MSSHPNDPTETTASAAQPPVASEDLYSLDEGMLERYLLGTLRPNEIEAATQFFSDPIQARVLRKFQEWAEQVPAANPPSEADKLANLWEMICDQQTIGSPLYDIAAKRAGRLINENPKSGRGKAVLGKQTLRTARQNEGIFSGRTLRGASWLAGGLLAIPLAVVMMRSTAPSRFEMTRTYKTHVGQQAIVTLGDGTRVTLAPQTSLTLTRFGTRSRTVALNGEAYFDVAQSSGVPFIVQSGRVMTRVLGTAFLVRHYDEDTHVQVVVAHGKVHLAGAALPSAGLTLTNGRAAVVSDSTVKLGTADDAISETGWLNGSLNFVKTPLPEVLATLSRWYGYRFRLSDSTLSHERITAALSTRSSAAALANLEQLLSVNLTVVGDTVVLTPQTKRPTSGTHRMRSYDLWTPTREVGR